MNRNLAQALFGVIATLCLCGTGRADILYDNLGAASEGTSFVDDFGPLEDSFSTGGSGVNLTDVKLLLTNGGVSGSGTVDVSLLSDSNTTPGSLLTSIGTISDADIDSSPKTFDLSLATPFALAADTRYWIELSTSDSSTAQWYWTLDTSGPGVANEFFANVGAVYVYPNSHGPYQMRLTAVAVPEPSSVLLLGLGGVTAFGLRWRGGRPIR